MRASYIHYQKLPHISGNWFSIEIQSPPLQFIALNSVDIIFKGNSAISSIWNHLLYYRNQFWEKYIYLQYQKLLHLRWKLFLDKIQLSPLPEIALYIMEIILKWDSATSTTINCLEFNEIYFQVESSNFQHSKSPFILWKLIPRKIQPSSLLLRQRLNTKWIAASSQKKQGKMKELLLT